MRATCPPALIHRHSNTHSRQLHPGCTELPSGSCGRPNTAPLCARALHTHALHAITAQGTPLELAFFTVPTLIKERTLGLSHFVSGHTFDYPFYAVLYKYLHAVPLVDLLSNKSN